MSDEPQQLEVTALTVYPVKSMRGIDLREAELTPMGLRHDRRFMVVRAGGAFVTQRDTPAMALIETSIDQTGLVLSREGRGFVRVPFDADGEEALTTRVWKDPCEVSAQGEVISRWITEALDSAEPLKLVAMAPGFRRRMSKGGSLGPGNRVLFADAAPFLVANDASLAAVNEALAPTGKPALAMNRFRPNITVRGLPAFAEHAVERLEGEGYAIDMRYPCERCIVTTIDQETAERDADVEPYRTLSRINPMPGREGKPAFGENATLAEGEGAMIRVGEVLTAVSRQATQKPGSE